MDNKEMKRFLFARYTNLPEYFREEIADGTFNLRDCLFRLFLETEEQKDAAQDQRDKLEIELEKLKSKII